MSGESMGPRIRHRYLAPFGILLVGLSLLVSTGVATGTLKEATRKISGVPASVTNSGSFHATASGCSATMSPYISHTFDLDITCKQGSFSSFKVAMNYAYYGVSAWVKNTAHRFSCKNTSSTSFSCSGVTVHAKKTVIAHVDSHAFLCSASPPVSAAVTVAGKKFNATETGCP